MKTFTGELLARVGDVDSFRRWDRLAAGARYCTHPIRLAGTVATVDPVQGTLDETYTTALEPDGSLLVPCGNRRASRCPSCSAVYRSDTWQLVAAGLRGGKGIPESVGEHPRVFVTLTAPSFGPVHTRRGKGKEARACHRERGKCEHGIPHRCTAVHRSDDPLLGTPLCHDCFDYDGAVLWNAVAPELWRRTTIYLRRALARLVGTTTTALSREVRPSYTKVAEYQRRGLVHFHAVIRLDGVDPDVTFAPPARYSADLLVKAVKEAVDNVAAPLPMERGSATWGDQLDVRVINPNSATTNPLAVAAYIAKYATKSTEALSPALDRTLDSEDVAELRASEHVRRFVGVCWRLGSRPELADLRLRKWAHAMGFRGHFSTRSRRYSMTLRFLRQQRQEWQRRKDTVASPHQGVERIGQWRLVGIGYRTTVDAWLAAAGRDNALLAQTEAREARRKERELLLAA